MIWAATEFERIDLGDARRNRRAIRLIERLSAKPAASIPQACGDWADTMGPTASSAMKRLSGPTSWRLTLKAR